MKLRQSLCGKSNISLFLTTCFFLALPVILAAQARVFAIGDEHNNTGVGSQPFEKDD